jgi:hypothetical protein
VCTPGQAHLGVFVHRRPRRPTATSGECIIDLPIAATPPRPDRLLALVVWSMVGIALWHFAVLVPDRFWGGIIGAFLAALLGAVATDYLLPTPGIPSSNPPGVVQALCAIPGSLLALAVTYWHGSRQEARRATTSSDR